MYRLAVMPLMALMMANGSGGQTPAPLDPVATIAAVLASHHVVEISEEHGDERSHAFRMGLIRDDRFTAVANDIVVEFGNSFYQDVMDRFVAGADVPDSDLRKVWQNTTQAHTIWDRPIYGEFFRAVRALNATRPRARQLRVLLGDPPIDWANVHSAIDRQKYLQMGRSRYPAEVINREVLAKGRKALVIYGAVHLMRQNLTGANLTEHLDATGIRPFVIVTHPLASLNVMGVSPDVWPVPSLALTAGTRLASQVDAVLYLGPASMKRVSRLDPALCADESYRSMRVARMLIANINDAGDRLAQECSGRR